MSVTRARAREKRNTRRVEMMKQKMLVNSMSNVESSSDLWYPELRLMLLTLNSEVHKLPDLIPIGPLVKMRFTKLQKLSIFIAST